jgi:Ca2+/Na+ antiporter
VAGEAVSVLQSLGLIFELDMAVLGLTVLAWGNSVGDLVADLSVARAGSPDMAVTACFAGPLFNLLVGLGFSFFVQTASNGPIQTHMKPSTTTVIHVSFIGLIAILCGCAHLCLARVHALSVRFGHQGLTKLWNACRVVAACLQPRVQQGWVVSDCTGGGASCWWRTTWPTC